MRIITALTRGLLDDVWRRWTDGAGLYRIARDLHVDYERLRKTLQGESPERFAALSRAMPRKQTSAAGRKSAEVRQQRRGMPALKRAGFVWNHPTPRHVDEPFPVKSLRVMADFSAEELLALTAKLQGYVALMRGGGSWNRSRERHDG